MMPEKKHTLKMTLLIIGGLFILFIVIVIANLLIVSKLHGIISEGAPVADYPQPTAALLVIDIQEATTGEYSQYPYFKEQSELLIGNINRALDSFKLMNLPVIYVRSEVTNPLINLINNSLAKGGPGAQNDKRMKIVSTLEVVKKGKDSFRNTRLDSILISQQVNELYIAGLDAAECVNATTAAAQNRRYRVNILGDAVLSGSKALTDSMFRVFEKRGINVVSGQYKIHSRNIP